MRRRVTKENRRPGSRTRSRSPRRMTAPRSHDRSAEPRGCGSAVDAYLEKQVGGGSDPLLEQYAQGPVLLLQVTHPRSQLHTLFSQVLQVRRVRGQSSEVSSRSLTSAAEEQPTFWVRSAWTT